MRLLALIFFGFSFTANAQFEKERSGPFDDFQTLMFKKKSSLEALGEIHWQIEKSHAGQSQTTFIQAQLGKDWVRWKGPENIDHHLDLEFNRLITTQPNGAQVNTSLYAIARKRLDVFTALSRGGQAETISFGEAGEFDRFWLEAAMGISVSSDQVDIETTANGFIGFYKDSLVVSASSQDSENKNCSALDRNSLESHLALMRHTSSLHPDIVEAFRNHKDIPCRFTFIVYSPDTPTGRRETWTRSSVTEISQNPKDTPITTKLEIAQSELLSGLEPAFVKLKQTKPDDIPDAFAFFDYITQHKADNDLAGAYLLSYLETLHFGPCPVQAVGSLRLACLEQKSLDQLNTGNAQFDDLLTGFEAAQSGDYALAASNFEPFLSRQGLQATAAHVLMANSLISWGQDGLAAYPDLDPAELLVEALNDDPYAVEIYGFLGQRYLAAGLPHAAWALFDLARGLPNRDETPSLAEIAILEQRQRVLAPGWFMPTQPPQIDLDSSSPVELEK